MLHQGRPEWLLLLALRGSQMTTKTSVQQTSALRMTGFALQLQVVLLSAEL